MDADQVATFRMLMAGSRWLEQAGSLGRALRTSPRSAGGLLVVGTPSFEPWHVTAHLDDEARLSGIAELTPTLVRWSPPAGAPPHLSVGLARLEAARRGETLFIVAADAAPVPLLERVNDARKTGATILALDSDDPELDALAHEALAVPPSLTFDAGQHLVSAAAGDRGSGSRARGLRARIARLLDAVSGPTALMGLPRPAADRRLRYRPDCLAIIGADLRLVRLLTVLGGPDYEITYPNGDRVAYVPAVYEAEITAGTPAPADGELSKVAWFTPAELQALQLSRFTRALLTATGHLSPQR